jgi:hypothetical protein
MIHDRSIDATAALVWRRTDHIAMVTISYPNLWSKGELINHIVELMRCYTCPIACIR